VSYNWPSKVGAARSDTTKYLRYRNCKAHYALATRDLLSLQTYKEGIMSGFGFIAWIVIGLIAGWLAEKIMKRDHGLWTNLIVGVVGALLGGFLVNLLGMDASGSWIVGIVVATLGAVILLFLLGMIKKRA